MPSHNELTARIAELEALCKDQAEQILEWEMDEPGDEPTRHVTVICPRCGPLNVEPQFTGIIAELEKQLEELERENEATVRQQAVDDANGAAPPALSEHERKTLEMVAATGRGSWLEIEELDRVVAILSRLELERQGGGT